MNQASTKWSYPLMVSSAIFHALLALCCSFLPYEILGWTGARPTPFSALVVQMAGALFLGFAMLNYIAKKAVTGGIYNRAICMGNLAYTMTASLVLLKFTTGQMSDLSPVLWLLCLSYGLLFLGFTKLAFSSPVKQSHV